MKRALLFFFATGFVSFAVSAGEVGRTNFDLPYPQWRLLTAYDTKTVFSGGATAGSSEPVYHKAYYVSDGEATIKALLLVGSQHSKYSLITWTGTNCPASKPNYFTNDFGSNQNDRTLACMIVSTRFSPSAYFKPGSPVSKALDEKQLKLFKSGYFLRAHFGSENGSQLFVALITQPDFKGLSAVRPSTEQIFDVPPELVAWAEALQKEVKSSVYSFGGGLKIPLVEFKQ